jgi:hypothetical protein
MTADRIVIDGVEYTRSNRKVLADDHDSKPYVLIRTFSAGVHVGYLSKKESTAAGMEVTLFSARRLWYWDGAATLSQLAMEGVTTPDKCKFSMPVAVITILAIEIIPCTEKALLNIQSVKEWKM